MADLINGPWKENNESSWSIDTDTENTYTVIVDKDGSEVAIVSVDSAFDKDEELDAKAALIAAAPDLLEALLAAKKVCDVAATMTSCRSDDDFVWSAQAKIDAAIAKATGGQ